MEYPVLTYPFGKFNFPVKLRHTGLFSVVEALKKINKEGHPGNFLLHPWELLPRDYIGNKLVTNNFRKWFREYSIPCDKKLNSFRYLLSKNKLFFNRVFFKK